jgi:hypothetical protein
MNAINDNTATLSGAMSITGGAGVLVGVLTEGVTYVESHSRPIGSRVVQ